ncbi:conserved Plasmodium protein, unknown function [Plasmodium malariae]|uniref:Uncharacterized protein n=1 Tax=Plasmodium malariae TaxID=5858 RepID=A0A1D3JLM8_PLAMA|nr:conserved Plasmodium protein, unknown function [Plasmodium malariae]SBT87502.1 conserved Plasmodium protein, unknown function [Plasmodium malariae]
MNTPHTHIPFYNNQCFFTKNVEPKKHNVNPFSNRETNGPRKLFSFPQMKANGHSNNNTHLKMNRNITFSIPLNMERRINSKQSNSGKKYFNNIASIDNNCIQNINFNESNKNADSQIKGQRVYKPRTSKSLFNLQNFKKKMNNSYNIYIEKCSRVIIFDLDDTLIPTCWIRSALLSKRNPNYDQALRELQKEIHLNKKYNFESAVCSVIHLAISMSHTVFIVTNARSDTWVETVRWLFPQFSKLLDECHIPIIRTDQYMEPSPLNVFEYFRYWMNAKKKKFDEILKDHCSFYHEFIANKIDFISLGDTEFEEVAAYELQSSNKNLIKRAFNVKVQTGLCIEDFIGQLKLIQVALSIVAKGSYDYKYLALSGSVQIKMFS